MLVRAWDAGSNTQPSDPTWNLLGMLNNSWYRVRINIDSESTRENPSISFQHPVRPGTIYGGWMPQNGEPRVSGGPHRGAKKNGISFEELKKHNNEKDCWIAIDGEVLDMTSYLQDHPGNQDFKIIMI
jgi:nitrate reductase (NAD(P)H)